MPIIQTIQVALHNHASLLYGQFAPIQKEVKIDQTNDQQNNPDHKKEASSQTEVNKKLHFTFPIFILLITSYLGTFHLPKEHQFTFETFSTNPEVFSHQVVPRALWTNFDYALSLTVFCTILILIYAAFRDDLNSQFKIVKDAHGQYRLGDTLLEAEVSAKIRNFQSRLSYVIWFCISFFYLLAMVFYAVNVLFLNEQFRWSFWSVLFWTTFYPPYIFYQFYGILGFQMYIIGSSRIIKIRQQQLLTRLQKLIQIKRSKNVSEECFAAGKWRSYMKLNRNLVHICAHIREYSRLNSPILSITIPYFMLAECYMLVAVLYGDPSVYPFCFTGISECNAIMYLNIRECAQIEQYNRKIEATLRRFYTTTFGGKNENEVLMYSKIKVFMAHRFAAAGRLRPYVFCIFSNYRITSKTYNAVLYFFCF